MISAYKNIHPKFKLNGISYSISALRDLGQKLSKEQDSYEVSIGNFLLDWLDNTSTVQVTTSGSTGTPKYIVLEKQHMVNSALATGSFFGLKAEEKALHCLPTDFIAGKMMLVRAMVLGLELDCVSPSSNPLENNKRPYDFCAMVPLQLQNSLKRINQIRTLIVGGAPMSIHLKEQVQDKTTHIYETYGMTETITHIAAKKVNCFGYAQQPRFEKESEVTEPSRSDVFQTLPNISISKDNRDCLIINAPSISNETIATNDVVKLVSETEFEWLGRYDAIINSGGIKLNPEQIEAKLTSIITSRFFVAGIPDTTLGQKLVLILEGDIDVTEIHQKIRRLKTLQKFEIPKEMLTTTKFVETKNGKTQRKKTLELLNK